MPVGDMAHRRRCFGQWMAPLDRRAQPINVDPAMLRYIDATVGCLRAPAEYVAAAQQFLPRIPAEEYPHMNALAQLGIDGKHSGIADFDLRLDLILDGLERLLAASA
ncbi:hypothetical protein [Nocardia sp. NPDC047038]|uniref:hypothetical protein n=1 Tax=Nocardia sp. NPDC047038 TaxID=3154338 RepID=UPI0033C2298E